MTNSNDYLVKKIMLVDKSEDMTLFTVGGKDLPFFTAYRGYK
jgi:hypothetical protein